MDGRAVVVCLTREADHGDRHGDRSATIRTQCEYQSPLSQGWRYFTPAQVDKLYLVFQECPIHKSPFGRAKLKVRPQTHSLTNLGVSGSW